jgi:hypothetical protein
MSVTPWGEVPRYYCTVHVGIGEDAQSLRDVSSNSTDAVDGERYRRRQE